MSAIQDREYLKICAEIASSLSISIASARRKVDLVALKEGAKDMQSRKTIALRLLNEAKLCTEEGGKVGANLDQLLEALAEDENFMVED